MRGFVALVVGALLLGACTPAELIDARQTAEPEGVEPAAQPTLQARRSGRPHDLLPVW
jgi:hypothetical protein